MCKHIIVHEEAMGRAMTVSPRHASLGTDSISKIQKAHLPQPCVRRGPRYLLISSYVFISLRAAVLFFIARPAKKECKHKGIDEAAFPTQLERQI